MDPVSEDRRERAASVLLELAEDDATEPGVRYSAASALLYPPRGDVRLEDIAESLVQMVDERIASAR